MFIIVSAHFVLTIMNIKWYKLQVIRENCTNIHAKFQKEYTLSIFSSFDENIIYYYWLKQNGLGDSVFAYFIIFYF